MKCPNDNVNLLMTDRQGIEIDYCPECRGIWLDKGELDKLIEKADLQYYQQKSPKSSHRDEKYNDYDEDDEYDNRNRGGKRKGGFLGDLMDFGD